MPADLLALARRAAPLLKWEVGMLLLGGGRIIGTFPGDDRMCPELTYAGTAGGGYRGRLIFDDYWTDTMTGEKVDAPLPDLADRATLMLVVGQARDGERPLSPLAMALHRWALQTIGDADLALAAVEALEMAAVRRG